MPYKPIVIGVGGFARSGKDTFVKIARRQLKESGYSSIKLAIADALKEEIDPFLKEYYGISAWTDDTEEKKIIRPLLVAHGCQKRVQTQGKYWVDKVDEAIENIHFSEDVIFISDCRFPNEVDWVHNKWGGWFVHLKKYCMKPITEYWAPAATERGGIPRFVKEYDSAPNEEEEHNDPICEEKSDAKLELENAIEREKRLKGNIITSESLIDNIYLNEEIMLCLSKCPFLTINEKLPIPQ